MDSAKIKVRNAVNWYKTAYKDEYKAFKTQQNIKQETLSNKFAEIKESDLIERKLWEIPENLYESMQPLMTEQEWSWFKSLSGSKWFIKEFNEFSASKNV